MGTMNNPATADQDMAGFRSRNAAASGADGDYIRRGEIEAAVINSLTAAYLATITARIMPLGTIIDSLDPNPPDATWLPAAGGTYSRATYALLYAKISALCGPGDGSTTFTLPDLRGKFRLASSVAHAAGATGGAETVSLTAAQNGPHTHDYTDRSSGLTLVATVGAGPQNGPFTNQTGSSGTGAPHENMPPYYAANVYIKALLT